MTVTDRFLKYVQIDTQSDPNSESYPSTEKQKNLGKLLVEELLSLGLNDAHLDAYGYVYATLESNTKKNIPVICFCSHVDTSSDCSGSHVKPLIHRNYQGQDLILPDDPKVIIKAIDHPDLATQIGNDIITASGLTLLGADNKAGIAAIVNAVAHLIQHPEKKHGTIKVLFTPDEEIGRGVDKVDLQKLAAQYAYTVDGETLGSLEDETFSADAGHLTIHGISSHPGFAKGKMHSAIKILSEIIHLLPKDSTSPESTENKQGFVHPVSISGTVEKATASFIIRDFDDDQLQVHAKMIQEIVENTLKLHPNCSYEWTLKEQYRNMKKILDTCPEVVNYGIEAIKRAGLTPKKQSIRGGTDGSRLSFMGLPCPNIFAGEHAFHSKQEWVSVQDMEKASAVIVNIAQIWEENG